MEAASGENREVEEALGCSCRSRSPLPPPSFRRLPRTASSLVRRYDGARGGVGAMEEEGRSVGEVDEGTGGGGSGETVNK